VHRCTHTREARSTGVACLEGLDDLTLLSLASLLRPTDAVPGIGE